MQFPSTTLMRSAGTQPSNNSQLRNAWSWFWGLGCTASAPDCFIRMSWKFLDVGNFTFHDSVVVGLGGKTGGFDQAAAFMPLRKSGKAVRRLTRIIESTNPKP